MSETRLTHILYMEDDPSLSLLLQKSLQRKGFIVDIAANGEEGLAMAAAAPYDILLIDYNMPFLGGIDVIRALASKGKFPPIIMVTGEGNEKVAVAALKLGAADYIVKDVEMRYLDLLPSVIDQILFKQQLIRERDQMQNAMQESEERYRLLVDLAADGISVHVDGKFVFMNPAGALILGASNPGQLIGMSMLDIVHPDNRQDTEARLRQLGKKADRAPWVEERYVRLDGRVIDVEVCSVNFISKGAPAVQMIFKDITKRKEVEEKLKQMALYDMLTGLPNRTLFFDRMNQLLELAKRNQYILAVLYVDLDRFKTINDKFGHEVGDLVLITSGQRMLSSTRRSDTVARIGGDEFIGVCARITAAEDAAVVAQKLIVNLTEPIRIKGYECSIGASIGISIYPQDGSDVETLLNKADAAMYRVKEKGKGGFEFFSDIPGASPVSAP